MGFLTDFLFEKRDSIAEINQKFLSGEDLFDPTTKSGARVSETIALSLSSVWACVNILSRIMASMPVGVYRNLKPTGKEKATDHSLYKVLYATPNTEQTSYEWRLLMYTHCLTWGAGISEIEYSRSGEIVGLWPIPPWRVSAKRTNEGSLFYEVTISATEKKKLLPSQVFILPFFSVDAGTWLSPIDVHRETIGSALAVKEFGAGVFGQGTNPGAILSGCKFAKSDNEESLRKKFRDQYAGLGNTHRLMLLEDGVQFTRVGLPPEDAQYLETRRFDISEIARIYNVPLFMLQDHEKQTSWGAGIEEQKQGLVDFTLVPFAVQFEQQAAKKLLFNDPEYFVKFNFNSLLRGKIVDRYNAYKIGKEAGFLSADDIRELEDMNPLPDGMGQVYTYPMNMVNAKFADYNPYEKEIDKETEKEDPEKTPDEAPENGEEDDGQE